MSIRPAVRRFVRSLLSAGCGALVACSGGQDQATDTLTTEPGGSTTVAGSDCACIDPEEFGGASYTCPKSPCDTLEARCVPGSGGGTGTGTGTGADTDGSDCTITVQEAALDCALDRLIQGQTGFAVEYTFTPDQGYSTEGGFIAVLGPDRAALTRTWSWVDLGGSDSNAGRVQLKDAAYFEACKSEPDLTTRFWCMTEWSEQAPDALCDAGGGADSP